MKRRNNQQSFLVLCVGTFSVIPVKFPAQQNSAADDQVLLFLLDRGIHSCISPQETKTKVRQLCAGDSTNMLIESFI